MELKWSYALLIVVFLGCGSCLDWQGAGNWTSDNLTVLNNMINAVSPSELTIYLSTDVKNISDQLNTLWAPAWNVVIVYYPDSINYDSVLYGYGFRAHWFWFNGWQRTDGTYLTFIIWKDYNCIGWVNFMAPSTFSSSATTSITNNVTSASTGLQLSDIWSVAHSIPTTVVAADSTILQDPLGYTIIASQSGSAIFYTEVCVSAYMKVTNIGLNAQGKVDGTALIM